MAKHIPRMSSEDLDVFPVPGRWARYELQIALLDSLFQSRMRSTKTSMPAKPTKRSFCEITAQYDWHHENGVAPDAIQIQITAPETLDVAAESVLLAILYLVKNQGHLVTPQSSAHHPMLLKPSGLAAQSPIGSIETTRYALLKIAGMPDSLEYYQRLQRLLRELGKIILTYRNLVTGEEGNDLLLRWQLQRDTDHLLIQINWRLAGAIFGTYLRAMIDLDERNALHSDPAKILHRWLSAHLWPGKSEWIL